MLFIDPDLDNIKEALRKHQKAIHCRVARKLEANCLNKHCQICQGRTLNFQSNDIIKEKVRNYLLDEDNLINIISAKPDELEALSDGFYQNILDNHDYDRLDDYFLSEKDEKVNDYPLIHDLMVDLGKLFDYKWLCDRSPKDDYSLYDLAKKLNRRSCTYCNRTYTTTMTIRQKGKLMRPQFDHWYPKWRYPILSLSFYNLIPSCYTCNSSSKGREVLDISKQTHPYLDKDQQREFSFSYINSSVNKYHVYVRAHNTNRRALNTIKALNIDTMYNAHIPELEDLIEIKKTYSENYLDKLKKFFPKSTLTNEDIYRLAFGTELHAKDFHKKPMSKFKHDILIELGVIKDKH